MLRQFWTIISKTFLAGVLAVLPLVITVAVAIWVSDKVADLIAPNTLLGDALQKLGIAITKTTSEGVVTPKEMPAYVIGWGVVLTTIYLLGMFVRMGATSVLQGTVDRGMARIPLMGSVYGTAKQLIAMFDKDKKADIQSMAVVYCNFGEERGASFLALMPTSEIVTVKGKPCHVIMIPTAPVPMGGSLLFVPEHCVEKSELTVDAFMSIYVSMGITAPKFINQMIENQAKASGS